MGVIDGAGLSTDVRSATIVVAASDAHPDTIASADFPCDGTADDVQILAALADLPAAGGMVVLSEGTFTIVQPLVIPDDYITLVGQGRSTFIDGDGLATGEHAISITGFTHCEIRDLAIQTGDGVGSTCHCIFLDDGCNYTHIENVTIVDSDADGIHIAGTTTTGVTIHDCHIEDADGHGIYVGMDAANSCLRICIDDCVIEGTGNEGIQFADPTTAGVNDYAQIRNNIISLAGEDGIDIATSNGSKIGDNLVLDCTTNGILATNCDECVFDNNVVWSCAQDGIAMEGTSVNNTISSNVCTDNGADGAFAGINTTTVSYMTITGNVCYNNRKYGIGFGVSGTGFNLISGNHCYFNYEDGIIGAGPDSVVIGNVCYNNSQGAASTDHGITLTNNCIGCSIIGNVCSDDGTNQEDGIHLEDGATNCLIEGNYCYNLMGDGIILVANNTATAIRGNSCWGNDENGIVVAASANCAVSDNYCLVNAHHGIYLNNADGANVTGNTSSGNDTANGDAYDGMYVLTSDHCVISSNICNENDRMGIWIYRSDYCTVGLNVCNTNGRDGIQVFGDGTANSDYNTLTGNVCTANTDDGIGLEGTTDCNKNIVLGNQLVGNSGTALVDNGTATDAGHNITA